MSKKNKNNKCPRCNSLVAIVDYCHDGAIWECTNKQCGETGITRTKNLNRYERKIKEIEVKDLDD